MLCLTASIACTDSTGNYSGGSLKAQVPAEASQASGAADYNAACSGCHRIDGLGTPRGNSLKDCESCTGTFHNLQTRVHATMPEGSPDTCEDTCATDTAAHILCAFNAERTDGCKIVVPATASPGLGSVSYGQQCRFCHGALGQGVIIGETVLGPPLTECESCSTNFAALQAVIEDTMPSIQNTALCQGQCAENTAAFILCEFNGELADGCDNPLQKPMIPPSADLAAGEAIYGSIASPGLCNSCHGENGQLGAPPRQLVGFNCTSCQGDFEALQTKIHLSMPAGSPVSCQDQCAEDTAAFILCGLNSDLAVGCPEP
jgi:cytochrome c